MSTTEITLTGTVQYHPRFPPNNAKKGYVAKITGRAAGALKYAREFLGDRVTVLEGDEGSMRGRSERKRAVVRATTT